MCGIAGFIGKKKIDEQAINTTLGRMKQRGPNAQNYVHIEDAGNQVYLLHSRLSIIDLDPRSNQPFCKAHQSLVFNGEIYNFVEIKKELQETAQIEFETNSDTEVLFHAYRHWGKACNTRFEGMWAYAMYDTKKHELVLSRDRFAEKPLFVFETIDGTYFGSEIKFIEALIEGNMKVNMNQVKRYLVNGYKSLFKTDENYFEGVLEVPFGHNLIINAELNKSTEAYWTPNYSLSNMSLDDAIEGTRHHLIESMRLRLRSDVPLAFCLSGGVDSAALASIASKEFNHNVHSFSIIDPDVRYNEFDNIKATINDLGCEHTLIELNTDGSLARLQELVKYHDAPVATISYLVHSMLSEQIAANGYKVAFSGTAADELYTGYYDHFNLHLYEMRNHPNYSTYLSDWNANTGKLVRNPFLQNPALYNHNPGFRDHVFLNNDVFASYLIDEFHEDFSETKYSDSLLHNRMMNELFHEGSRVILREDDLNSMKYSIENRSPYLDSKLAEFAYSIPLEHLMKDGYGKYVLRESMAGILNDKVRLDRQKKGFNAAISSLVDFNNPADRDWLLAESPVFDVIDRNKITEIMNMAERPNSFSKFLFNFINVKFFLEQHG